MGTKFVFQQKPQRCCMADTTVTAEHQEIKENMVFLKQFLQVKPTVTDSGSGYVGRAQSLPLVGTACAWTTGNGTMKVSVVVLHEGNQIPQL